ncbi:MAG: hypothetical protein J7M25_03315, partial [Deltaproteobacteria bacterium]|nr:hypothetical protein [Deltaproteobacteria bacterium]
MRQKTGNDARQCAFGVGAPRRRHVRWPGVCRMLVAMFGLVVVGPVWVGTAARAEEPTVEAHSDRGEASWGELGG